MIRIYGKYGVRYVIENGVLFSVSYEKIKRGKKEITVEKRTRYLKVGNDTEKALRYISEIEGLPLWKIKLQVKKQAKQEKH